uniref:Spermine synthase n=1 Tax=Solibacter usitatus (strain Ellin6076) TaxID=234267 RepID=Q020T5_SOLUE
MKPNSPQWREVYLCVALTTMATLLLELALTRIFSVVFYYHFAFLAISIALFGLGLGGVFSYVVAGWKAPLFARLGRLSLVNSLLVTASLGVLLGQGDTLSNWDLALVYFTTALPFFVAGAIVSLAISETIEHVDRIYFFDLAGAAAGCFLLLAMVRLVGGPDTVIVAAVTFAVAAAIWNSLAGSVRGRAGSVVVALALFAFIVYNQKHPLLTIRHAKGQALPVEVFKQWNDLSRIGVVRQSSGDYNIVIDADAATTIAHFDFDHLTPDNLRDLMYQGPALPYAVRPGAKTLIIGPGGGWDVARAIAAGSRDVTAVEINPIIAHTVMQQRFARYSNNLYWRPEVHLFVEDGRSFVRRSTSKYQVMQATLVDTWAATAAGAFALSENNLYTSDAFRDYLNHLTDDGVLAITRWGFDPPRESLRLISLAIDALTQLGEKQPWRHVIVSRQGTTEGYGALDTVLISRKPFSDADIARAQAVFSHGVQRAIYYPGSEMKNEFRDLLLSPQPVEYERNYTFDITPVTDDRPFFFYTVQPRDLWAYMKGGANTADRKINNAVPLLFGLMIISLLATMVILIAPPLVLGARLPTQRGVRGFLVYFLLIGAGYILIEVGLIQKFILFLGHPTYALTVVIFSMLISSGLGSYFSKRVLAGDEGRMIKVLGLTALLTTLLALVLSSLLSALVWLPWFLKTAMTVALIAPLGFIMGMPFPTGLKRLEEWHAPSVRWAWSLNAAASVLGSVGALVSAIYLGLAQTIIIGGLFYLGALAIIARVRPPGAPAPEPGPGRVVLAR